MLKEANDIAVSCAGIYKMRSYCAWQVRISSDQIFVYKPASSGQDHIKEQRKRKHSIAKYFLLIQNRSVLIQLSKYRRLRLRSAM